jgi:peptidoglycan/LPS O-acetylase OafA/YrhL
MSASPRIYFKNFDGLRCFAAMAVICAHFVTVFGPEVAMGSWTRILLTLDNSGAEAGVNFFFVLSGFLITYLILADPAHENAGFIPAFYLRRVLRIWPLYYLTVAIGFWLYPWMTDVPNYVEGADWRMYLVFLANLDQIWHWKSLAHPNPLLGVHWSVAVEEQFYLVWPWIMLLARRRFVVVGAFLVLVAFLFQVYTGLPSHTISCFHDLTIGGLAAYLCYRHPEKIQRFFRRLSQPAVVLLYGLGMLLIVGRYQATLHFPVYESIHRPVNALIFAFIIIDQGFNTTSPIQISRIPVIGYLGKISYGLYLLHPVALLLVRLVFPGAVSFYLAFPLIIVASIALSMLSYHFFEQPFLKLKSRLQAGRN